MAVRIVTDSSSDLEAADAGELGVEIVPLSIRFGSDEFTDRVNLSVEDFYAKMADSPTLPETAAPSPGAFEAAFRRQAQRGADSVVCVVLSAALSATMEAAQTAAKALEGELDVRVVDSRSISAGLGTIVRHIAEAAAEGQNADAIVALVNDLAGRTRIVGVLDTLDNLKKGGRVGGAQALVGSMLSIKPLVDISSGAVEEAGRARTRRKALLWLRDTIFEFPRVDDLVIVHGMAPDVDQMVSLLEPRYGPDDIRVATIGPVIGTHAGPRVMGATWINAE
jgi:DegV family protein with EDD domain